VNIFMIGAAGGLGRYLLPMLSADGDTVTGMHRRPEQAAAVAAVGATPVTGDLIGDSVSDLSAKMVGHDAVVFAAGAHGAGADQTTLIDGKGLEKAADAAAVAGARRFVLVSAFPDSERTSGLGEGFEHYLRVKKAADGYLTTTDLDWIIVRPGHLLDVAETGTITAGLALTEADINRGDLARFIALALHHDDLNRTIVELTNGTTPIPEAVATIANAVGTRRTTPAPGEEL
jgi:uncharacterized protein YbjT (DUF2867 family)